MFFSKNHTNFPSLKLSDRIVFNMLLLLLILSISRTTIFPYVYVMSLISLFMLGRFLLQNRKINRGIIIFSLIWLIINLLVFIIFSEPFDSLYNIGFILTNFFLPFLIYTTYNSIRFWESFEKMVYALSFLSIPLYILNSIFPEGFNSLSSVFGSFTREVFLGDSNFWSAGFYTNATIKEEVFGISFLRNCGFMWEPGYFALMIIWGIVFSWLRCGIGYSRKFLVYLIALLTTFSTAGYIALSLLLITLHIKKINFLNILILTVLLIFFNGIVFKFNFIEGKLDTYINNYQSDAFNYTEGYNAVRLNRLQIAVYDVERTLRYPLGFGKNDRISFEGVHVVGTNGLSGLMRMWGIPVFIFFIYYFYRFIYLLNKVGISRDKLFLFFLSLMVVFFSQSVQYSMLTYFMIVFSITFKGELYESHKS